MKFGLDKCGVLTMKSGKELEGDGIVIENIGPIGEEEYKYFGSLKKGDICQEEMKKNIRKECLKRLKSTLKLKLNAKHVLQATNTWVVPNVRESAGINEWGSEGNVSKNKKEHHHVW